MKDPYIKIKLSELTRLNNRITLLEQRLREYEPSVPEVKLLNTDGSPRNRTTYPLVKPGKESILETLPDGFTMKQALQAGIKRESSVRVWKYRQYIYEKDGKFYKTDIYKERLRQAKLTNLSDEILVNKINS